MDILLPSILLVLSEKLNLVASKIKRVNAPFNNKKIIALVFFF